MFIIINIYGQDKEKHMQVICFSFILFVVHFYVIWIIYNYSHVFSFLMIIYILLNLHLQDK